MYSTCVCKDKMINVMRYNSTQLLIYGVYIQIHEI